MTTATTLELPYGLPDQKAIVQAAWNRQDVYPQMVRKYARMIGEDLMNQGCIPAIPYRGIDMEVIWTENMFARDPDGIRSGIRFVLDAMVQVKVIDDRFSIRRIGDRFMQGSARVVQVSWTEAP